MELCYRKIFWDTKAVLNIFWQWCKSSAASDSVIALLRYNPVFTSNKTVFRMYAFCWKSFLNLDICTLYKWASRMNYVSSFPSSVLTIASSFCDIFICIIYSSSLLSRPAFLYQRTHSLLFPPSLHLPVSLPLPLPLAVSLGLISMCSVCSVTL